jgi:hypothetical protein
MFTPTHSKHLVSLSLFIFSLFAVLSICCLMFLTLFVWVSLNFSFYTKKIFSFLIVVSIFFLPIFFYPHRCYFFIPFHISIVLKCLYLESFVCVFYFHYRIIFFSVCVKIKYCLQTVMRLQMPPTPNIFFCLFTFDCRSTFASIELLSLCYNFFLYIPFHIHSLSRV